MTDRVPVPTVSPFQRLTQTLAGIAPGKPPISRAVGEPQHPIPDFVDALTRFAELFPSARSDL